MNTYKILLATALVTPVTLAAVSATAQTANVAIADPDAAIANSKVWAAAQAEIGTTYKAQLDQAKARGEAIAAELQPLYKKLDANGDNQLNPQEIEAARTARRPEIAQIEAKEKAGQEEIGRMTAQASRARAYAAEQVAGKVNDAVTNVVKSRRITLLIRPNAAYFADPAADITPAISTEIDRLIPKASITPPANWQPGQQQAAQRPAGTPAPAAPKPAERPR
jgi:Skp family chaperone for outer membrane proteins